MRQSLIQCQSFFAIILFLSSCVETGPDVSSIHSDIAFKRFEQDLFKLDTASLDQGVQFLKQAYPDFYPVYFKQITGFNIERDSGVYTGMLKQFLSNKAIQGLYDSCQYHYSDMSEIKSTYDQAFKYYQHYFPGKYVPNVVTFISEFGYSAVATDSSIALGLDMHLGPKYVYYPSIGFPDFMLHRLSQEYLAINGIKAWLQSEDEMQHEKSTILDHMVYEGKLLYVTHQLLPEMKKSLIIGFKPEQWDWCMANQEEMWAHFIQHEVLYKKEGHEIRRYVGEGPNTPGMPPEAPANTGSWVGWQIVEQYMERFPNTLLSELMAIEDANLILQKSKYKPER